MGRISRPKCIVYRESGYRKVVRESKYKLKQCKSCKLYILSIDKKSIIYGDDFDLENLEEYERSLRPVRDKQQRMLLKYVLRQKAGGTWLDIGCSLGWFLKKISKFYQAYGIEPSPIAYQHARSTKYKVLLGEFPEKDFKIRYDIVSIMDVLEHLRFPERTLTRVHKKMKRRGILIVKVPNSNGLIYRASLVLYTLSLGKLAYPLKRMLQIGFNYPHFFYFNRRNLSTFLERDGFIIKKVIYTPEFSFRTIMSRINQFGNMNRLKKTVYACLLTCSFFLEKIFIPMRESFILIAEKNDIPASKGGWSV